MPWIPLNTNNRLFCSDLGGIEILNYQDDIGGYITSPGYPAHYPDNINYTWILRSRHMTRIDIRIIHMNILQQVPCGDYLEVCVGNNILSNTCNNISFSLFLFLFPFLYMFDLNVAKTKVSFYGIIVS